MLIKTRISSVNPVLAGHMRLTASQSTWDGTSNVGDAYFDRCRHWDPRTGANMIFTRDVGYHSSGWWKNPDYERCQHLSLSFRDPITEERRPQDSYLAGLWCRALFGDHYRWIWCEPPYSPQGRAWDVWHYRLFCDEAWQPIKPRGEVYSRELTEAGWRSWSEVHADKGEIK